MSKYNDYLTEIVYQIDDIIYDFYRKSNEAIAKKRNTENLINFRDETISTVNDMNVRALEMIASFKKDYLVEERAEVLLQRNKDILESAYQVLLNAPNKGEFFEEMKEAAKDAIGYTSKAVSDFQTTETYANIVGVTEKGYTRLKDAVTKVSQDEKVQEGFKTVKDKSSEVIHTGEKVLKKWWKDVKKDTNEYKEDVQETYEDIKDDVEDIYEDIKEDIDDKRDAFLDLKEEIEDNKSIQQDELNKEIEEIQEALNELRNEEGDSEWKE